MEKRDLITKTIYEKDLNYEDKTLLVYLIIQGNTTEKGKCYYSIDMKRIENQLGITSKTIKKYLIDLQKHDCLKIYEDITTNELVDFSKPKVLLDGCSVEIY